MIEVDLVGVEKKKEQNMTTLGDTVKQKQWNRINSTMLNNTHVHIAFLCLYVCKIIDPTIKHELYYFDYANIFLII